MIKILLVSLFLASMNALAGPRIIGNGGYVLVCTTGNTSTYEVLDYYEAREVRGLSLNLPQSSDYKEIAKEIANRIQQLNPNRANLYNDWIESFEDEALFTNDQTVVGANDIGAMPIPGGCTVEQAIAQQSPEFPGDRRYIVDTYLWSHLDSANKAGLVLHEIIYREMLAQVAAPNNSKYARFCNAVISADLVQGMSLRSYNELLANVHLMTGDAQGGVPVLLLDFQDGELVTTSPVYRDSNTIKGAVFTDAAFMYDLFDNEVTVVALRNRPDDDFDSNGVLKSMVYESDSTQEIRFMQYTIGLPKNHLNVYDPSPSGLIEQDNGHWIFKNKNYQVSNGAGSRVCSRVEILLNSNALLCDGVAF